MTMQTLMKSFGRAQLWRLDITTKKKYLIVILGVLIGRQRIFLCHTVYADKYVQ